MTDLTSGDTVRTPDGTIARFVRLLNPTTAIISVGMDSRIVDPVILRKVES